MRHGDNRERERIIRDTKQELDRLLSENSDLKSEVMRLQGVIEDERIEKNVRLRYIVKQLFRSSLM